MNRYYSYSKAASQCALGQALRIGTYVLDLLLSQARSVVAITSGAMMGAQYVTGVFDLLSVGHPFQVARVVVLTVAIRMVHGLPQGSRAEEGFSNQRMDRSSLSLLKPGERNKKVAVGTGSYSDEPSGCAVWALRILPISTGSDASYPAEAADLVDPFPAGDGSPFFDAATLMLHYVDSCSRGVVPRTVRAVPGLLHDINPLGKTQLSAGIRGIC